MALEIARPAGQDLDHLVDAVGELVAAVLERDRRAGKRPVAAIDVGDPRHRHVPVG